VRTLKNANVPIMIDRNAVDPGSGFWSADLADLNTAYMVNLLGASTIGELPAELDAVSQENQPAAGGVLVVTDVAGTDADGTQKFLSAFWVRAAPHATGEALRLYYAQEKLIAEHEATVAAQSRRERRRTQREAAPDLFAAIRSVLVLHPDGRVTSTERYTDSSGKVTLTIQAERVSDEAYTLSDEALRQPTLREYFQGSIPRGSQ
jgi:hypothetical protein